MNIIEKRLREGRGIPDPIRVIGDEDIGRFSEKFAVANADDVADARRGRLSPTKVRRLEISGVADSGASKLVLSRKVADQLGLQITGQVKVRYANGRRATRDYVENVYVEIAGRHGVFGAVVEPKRKDAIIGAIVLEDLDLLVDCNEQRLRPRDPDMMISELD